MKPADLFRKLSALGLSQDQIAGVLDLMDEEAEGRKEKARERWRKWKNGQSNVSKRLPTTANVSSTLARADPSLSTLEIAGKEESKKDTSPAARSRGERIPGDFIPDIAWAVAQGLTANEAAVEANQFIDYWRGKPGKDGLKLDWPGTWRMWVRNAIKRRGRAPPGNRRTISDVISDKMDEANGHQGIFGNRGNVERLSPRLIESRSDDENIRGGIAGRIVGSNR